MDDINDLIVASYRNNKDKFVFKIRKILKYNKHLAEDIVQESYERAFRYSETYRPSFGTFNVWFNRILYTTLRKYQKENSKHVHLDFEDVVYPLPLITDEIIKVKNKKHKDILVAFFILGYTSKEISGIYEGVTVTNVTTICKRFIDGLNK